MKKYLLILCLLLGCKPLIGHYPERSVVMMVTDSSMTAGGTGFEVIAPSGRIYTLTNAHICKDNATNAVVGDRVIPLRVIEIAQGSDLCLLEPVIGYPGLSVADESPKANEDVDIYGYGMLLPLTHSTGKWIGKTSDLFALMFGLTNAPEYTTVPILPGNSGSPVLNRLGQVIGVAFASGAAVAWRALIMPLGDVKTFLRPY